MNILADGKLLIVDLIQSPSYNDHPPFTGSPADGQQFACTEEKNTVNAWFLLSNRLQGMATLHVG